MMVNSLQRQRPQEEELRPLHPFHTAQEKETAFCWHKSLKTLPIAHLGKMRLVSKQWKVWSEETFKEQALAILEPFKLALLAKREACMQIMLSNKTTSRDNSGIAFVSEVFTLVQEALEPLQNMPTTDADFTEVQRLYLTIRKKLHRHHPYLSRLITDDTGDPQRVTLLSLLDKKTADFKLFKQSEREVKEYAPPRIDTCFWALVIAEVGAITLFLTLMMTLSLKGKASQGVAALITLIFIVVLGIVGTARTLHVNRRVIKVRKRLFIA